MPWLVVWLLTTITTLTVSVSPKVIFAGGAVRVTCRVPPRDDNRAVTFGIEGYAASGHQLDGSDSRITWELLIEHVPCDVGTVFCDVGRADGSHERVVAPFEVAACNAEPVAAKFGAVHN